MTQKDRLERRDTLRAEIEKHEKALDALRAEETRLLEGCEHTYPDGRRASAGGRIKICAICGKVLPARDEKLWG